MLNTCKGLHMLLCSALSMAYMQPKQSINIHAKAYKVIAMQYKAIKALSNTRLLNVLCNLYLILCKN